MRRFDGGFREAALARLGSHRATVKVNGKQLLCGPKIRALKNLEGNDLEAADDAIVA
jgi:hypothetical protein